MGLLTGSELLTEIMNFLAGRDDLQEDQPRLLRSLNLVQEYVELIYEPNELEASQTGTLTAHQGVLDWTALPSVPRRIKSFLLQTNDGRSKKLDGYSPIQFDAAFPDPDFWSENMPFCYTKFANNLELYPVPDAAYAYRIRYQKKAHSWTASNLDTTSDLDGKDLVLINFALSHIYDSLGEVEKSMRFYAVANGKAEELKAFDDRRIPDQTISAHRSVSISSEAIGRPWADPLVRMTR